MARRDPIPPHECKEATGCCCSIGGLEPNDDCPVHGCGEWPPRCQTCGKFIKRPPPEPTPCYKCFGLPAPLRSTVKFGENTGYWCDACWPEESRIMEQTNATT